MVLLLKFGTVNTTSGDLPELYFKIEKKFLKHFSLLSFYFSLASFERYKMSTNFLELQLNKPESHINIYTSVGGLLVKTLTS